MIAISPNRAVAGRGAEVFYRLVNLYWPESLSGVNEERLYDKERTQPARRTCLQFCSDQQRQMLDPDVEPVMSPITGKSHMVKADSPRNLWRLVVIGTIFGCMSLSKLKWLR